MKAQKAVVDVSAIELRLGGDGFTVRTREREPEATPKPIGVIAPTFVGILTRAERK
jgi:hypothetical protein